MNIVIDTNAFKRDETIQAELTREMVDKKVHRVGILGITSLSKGWSLRTFVGNLFGGR
jgi:hypothetical protein